MFFYFQLLEPLRKGQLGSRGNPIGSYAFQNEHYLDQRRKDTPKCTPRLRLVHSDIRFVLRIIGVNRHCKSCTGGLHRIRSLKQPILSRCLKLIQQLSAFFELCVRQR